MYKYIGVDEKSSMQVRSLNNDLPLREFPRNLKSDVKTKKIFRFCNPPSEIIADTEGMLYDYEWGSIKSYQHVQVIKLKNSAYNNGKIFLYKVNNIPNDI